MVLPSLSALFVVLPSSIKGLLAGPVSPVGIEPHPAVALMGLDGDPVVENGEEGILSVFIPAEEWDFAVTVGVHDPAYPHAFA